MSASPHHCTDITRVLVNLHATLWQNVDSSTTNDKEKQIALLVFISHLVGSKMEGGEAIPGQTGRAEAF